MKTSSSFMNRALIIDLKSDFVVYVTVLSGVGVDVHISRKVNDYKQEQIKLFWRVDRHPELMQEALDVAEAIMNGTYTGGAPHGSATAV